MSKIGADAKPLASHGTTWQGGTMTDGNRQGGGDRKTTGAGAIIALLILGGAIVGGLMGQPSAGLLVGCGAGILIALLLYLRERKG